MKICVLSIWKRQGEAIPLYVQDVDVLMLKDILPNDIEKSKAFTGIGFLMYKLQFFIFIEINYLSYEYIIISRNYYNFITL